MTIEPLFTSKTCGGIPLGVRLFKNSVEKFRASSSSSHATSSTLV